MAGLNERFTVVKLGGSLLTEKDIPLSPDYPSIRSVAKMISRAIRQHSERLFLIHGGGSFGHYYASRYKISTFPKKILPKGVAKTAASMVSLHMIVLDELVNSGVPCKTVLTSEILDDKGSVSRGGHKILENIFRNELVPISFGNVWISERGSEIISGDRIALALARSMNVAKMIFALDVDGVFPDPSLKGDIITELLPQENVQVTDRKYDVTGGMSSKISMGFEISQLGAEVYFMNGKKRGRLESLILGKGKVVSTHIPAMRISI